MVNATWIKPALSASVPSPIIRYFGSYIFFSSNITHHIMRGTSLQKATRALLTPRCKCSIDLFLAAAYPGRARIWKSDTELTQLDQIRYATTSMRMPAMSPTMTEGGIAGWKKAEGEAFTTGDVLLEIVCDLSHLDSSIRHLDWALRW